MTDQQECVLAEEDLPNKETSLPSENCIQEETSLPVMVEAVPVSEESSIKETGNESQPENAGTVAVEENHVEVEENHVEEKVHEEEQETRKDESNVCIMEDVD